MDWRSLSTKGDLEVILEDSLHSPQAIFKHSTRCGISSMAKARVESKWEKTNPSIPIHLLDLISNRELSNFVAEYLNVRHESPQLILLEKGEVVYHASHISISSSAVAKHIQKKSADQ